MPVLLSRHASPRSTDHGMTRRAVPRTSSRNLPVLAKSWRTPSFRPSPRRHSCLVLLVQIALILLVLCYSICWLQMNRFQTMEPHGAFPSISLGSKVTKKTVQAPQTIAYLISITACPAKDRHAFLDMAAVLKRSIHQTSIRNPASGSKYDYAVYAFLHPNATDCESDMQRLGYTVLVRETPVKFEEIQNKAYRDILFDPSNGCCGEKELLKLYSYTMYDYPVVVHLDLDFLILKPLDILYDVLLTPSSGEQFLPFAMHPEDKHRPTHQIQSMFTRDYPMSVPGMPSAKVGMQGGFLVIKPSEDAFNELLSIVRRGNFRPKVGRGWYDDKVQFPDFYGAPQIQGLIGFFYGHYHPEQTVELNRCVFNAMADNPLGQHGVCRLMINGNCSEDCRTTPVDTVYSAHFTFCGKPLKCPSSDFFSRPQNIPRRNLCVALHEAWHRTRYELELEMGTAKPYDKGDRSYGHCSQSRQYIPMNL